MVHCPYPDCLEELEELNAYCTKCGRSPDLFELGVTLSYKRFEMRAGESGVIPLKLTNGSQERITGLSLDIVCDALDGGDGRKLQIDREIIIPSGKSFEIRDCNGRLKEVCGQYRLKISGFYSDGSGRRIAFEGSRSFQVGRQVGRPGGKLVIGPDAVVSCESGQYDEIEIGANCVADLGSYSQHNTRIDGEWVEVKLIYDLSRTRLLAGFGHDSVPENYASSKRRAKGIMRISDARQGSDAAGTSVERVLWILTGRSWSLGNGEGDPVDIITRLLPRSAGNEKRNQLISRNHCTLTMDARRGLRIADHSMNGTRVDGKLVPGVKSVQDGQSFCLADVFHLSSQTFRDLDGLEEVRRLKSNSLTVAEYSRSLDTMDRKQLTEKAEINCCLLSRKDGFADRLSYLLLSRLATIGSSRSNPICIEGTAPQHAQLLFVNDGFVLRNLGTGRTVVNGRTLAGQEQIVLPGDRETRIEAGTASLIFSYSFCE